MVSGPVNAVTRLLLQLDRDRCQALVAGDHDRLRQILHPDLFHVHARGTVEDCEHYLDSLSQRTFAIVQRFDDLKVRDFGNTAFMSGRQLAESVRRATGERVRIDSMVTQVWTLEGDRWRQLSYQTTPIEMTVTPAS
jgi:ketosteroid isomerase-like protein